jgi:hypothetical protein
VPDAGERDRREQGASRKAELDRHRQPGKRNGIVPITTPKAMPANTGTICVSCSALSRLPMISPTAAIARGSPTTVRMSPNCRRKVGPVTRS